LRGGSDDGDDCGGHLDRSFNPALPLRCANTSGISLKIEA